MPVFSFDAGVITIGVNGHVYEWSSLFHQSNNRYSTAPLPHHIHAVTPYYTLIIYNISRRY